MMSPKLGLRIQFAPAYLSSQSASEQDDPAQHYALLQALSTINILGKLGKQAHVTTFTYLTIATLRKLTKRKQLYLSIYFTH
jgi:hypothetical protein